MKPRLRELLAVALERLRVERVLTRGVHLESSGAVARIGSEGIDLARWRALHVVAFGKAARPMARGLAASFAPHQVQGILVVPREDDGEMVPGFREMRAGHPLPDEGSFAAADAIVERLSPLSEDDLVIFLISGGGSALVERPRAEGIEPSAWACLYEALVGSGAGIVEINAVRKHLSALKGGRMAMLAHPARQVTLYVSDVPPGCPSAVASGPTMPDETTAEACADLIEVLRLEEGQPPDVVRALRHRPIVETPKAGDPLFSRSSWHELLSNDDAVRMAADAAEALGWRVEIDRSADEAPVDDALEHLLGRLDVMRRGHGNETTAVIAGGEVRSRVTGNGTGGRNQAFVLRSVPRIAGQRITVLSAGTDGIDGNSPAAGAVADGETLARARAACMDIDAYDRDADSFTFFHRLGDAVITGPTRQNVRDLRILVADA